MDQKQFIETLSRRIFPLLQEAGIEGCVVTGYFTNPEGKMGKFNVMLASQNIAIHDGLSPLVNFGSLWCAPAKEFPAPTEPEPPGSGVGGAPA